MRLSRIKRPKALWWRMAHPDGLPMKPRTRIKPRSDGMAKRVREYLKMKATWIPGRACEYPGCDVKQATDVHHSRGKLGVLLFLTEFWRAMCRKHHDWVGANPQAARDLCLLCN